MKELVIYFDEEITDKTAKQTIDALRNLAIADPTVPVEIRINSNGGSLQASRDIAKALRRIPNPVTTVCESRAMSGGLLMLAAGDKGKRFVHQDAELMAHQVQFTIKEFHGSAPSLFEYAKSLLKTNRTFMRDLAGYTGMPTLELLKRTQTDWYFGAQDAVKYGFADAIIMKPKGG